MPSFRTLVNSAVDPVPFPISLRSVANSVGLGIPPISGRRVLDFLSPPLVLPSGVMHALTVKASGGLALHPSGLYNFTGHAHENGVVGNNYAFGCAIDVLDDDGRAFAITTHEKRLSGTASIGGDRDDDFQVIGFDERIRDRWDEFRKATVRFSLHAATDPLQVVELVAETLVAALAVTGLVFLAIIVIPSIPTPALVIEINPDTGEVIVKLVWHFHPPP